MTRTELLTKYAPLAYSVASDFNWPGADRDDVRQEALVALWSATEDWKRHGSFGAFARVVIRRHLLDCVRHAKSSHRHGEVVPLLESDLSPVDVETTVINADRLFRALRDAGLTDREKHCLSGAARGDSYEELSSSSGLTVSTIKWHVHQARNKLAAVAA